MEALEYDEFDLLLETSGDGFSARVISSPTGPTKAVPFVPPREAEGLRELVRTLNAVRGVHPVLTEAAPDAKQFGKDLFNALFHDEALNAFRGSLHVSGLEGRGLRLRLRFADSQSLANIPWELLYDPERHRFPCQYGKYPVVRFVEIPEPVQPLTVTGPVRMLVVISSPGDHPPLDVEKEWSRLGSALKPLVDVGRLQVDRLPTASLEGVRKALLNDEFHVFHFMGHGGVTDSGDGVLVFTGPDGLGTLETGQDLGVMLSNSPIRLAVLNSCDGARVSEIDPYAGAAVSLVHQGIPAVVAMQFAITDQAAIAFSSTLYESITSGRPVDLAVTLARQAILATSRTEWATPVLYLRTQDGVVFDIEDRGPLRAPLSPPTDLTGSLGDEGTVSLTWHSPTEASAPATHWEVYRDASLVGEVTTPAAQDTPPSTGSYAYTVVAIAEQGRRSPPSELCTVVIAEQHRPPEPPTTPIALEGRQDGKVLALQWVQPHSDDVSILSWEILRDGREIATTSSPDAIDAPPGRGPFSYTVVAVAPDGRRSAPSEAYIATLVGGRWRWAVLLLLAVLLAVVLFVVLRPAPVSELTRPTGLVGTVTGTTVSLRWDAAPPGSQPVSRWQVLRDGIAAGSSTRPVLTDSVKGGDTYTYTVVALGPLGQRSGASAPWIATVSRPTPTPIPTPIPTPVASADLTIRFFSEAAGAGSGELDVTFQTDNLGGQVARDERVTVQVEPPGRLLAATVLPVGSAQGTPCEVHESGATCIVGIHPLLGVAKVTVTVLTEGEAFDVSARASSDTRDPRQGNNRASHRVQATTPSPTTASPVVTAPAG